MKPTPYVRRRPVIEEIEPRILYSADIAPMLPEAAAPVPVVEHRVIDQTGEFIGAAAPDQQARRQEVVFVDTATPDCSKLVADIEAQSGPERQLHVVLLDAHADGIQQISAALAQLKDVSAVHIIGHGADAEVRLGGATLNLTTLAENAARIQGWGQSLAPGADLLLYGCDVAQAADGRALVDALGRLTGAAVAASENLTGAAAQGGDWILEYHTGHIETQLAVRSAEQAAWNGLLDTAIGTPAAIPSSTSTAAAAPATPSAAESAATDSAATTTASAQTTIASIPLAFERNVGQADARVDYLARGNGYGVALTGGDAVLGVQNGDASQVLLLHLVGANTDATAVGEDLLAARSNYLIGGQGQWHTDIANYGGVRYDNVYDGVDLRYYGNQRQLEYDFIVRAGASADAIKLSFDGVQNIAVADNGDLVLTLDSAGHSISFKAPVAYQDGPDGREAVASRYCIEQDGTVGFEVGTYDASRQLVIDPVLSYGTYFGGTGGDVANSIAVDTAGNVYLTGFTPGNTGLAGVLGLGGGNQVFVTKLSPDLSSAIYTAYVGGSGDDFGGSIAVDASGSAYVTGGTQSSDFPTVSAYQSSITSSGLLTTPQDAFVFKLNAAGNALVYSTYLGGSGTSDAGWGIALDAAGNAYVAGVASSADFPITAGAADTAYSGGEAFAAKLSPAGNTLIYSSFIGGNGAETGYGIAIDAAGDAVVTGNTSSTNLPTTATAFQSSYAGNTDIFVAKLNSAGSAFTYLSYVGGSSIDIAYNVTLDGAGKIYLTGQTSSSNFALSSNAFQTALRGSTDAFVTVLDPSVGGSAGLIYSTFLGGSNNVEAGLGIGVDAGGRIYIAGQTDSSNFQVTAGAYKTTNASKADAFVVMIDPHAAAANSLVYGSYFGGTKDDYGDMGVYSNGKFYIAGDTLSSSGIATSGSADSTYGGSGNTDAFAAIFSMAPVVTTTATALAYTEDAGALALDAGLTVSDAGIANLASATVQITSNYASGEDVLAFNNANPWGIVGTWDAASGTLALAGTASVANYQAALRSVTYQNTSERPGTSSRTVCFSVSDGVLDATAATRQIAVTSVNDPPTIVAQSGSTGEDTPLIFSVANGNPISIADVDAGTGSMQVTVSATNGVLTLAQTTGLTFVTGNGSANATMTFTGALTSINAALDGLRFDPDADFNGSAALMIVTNDQGNTGTGGALSAALSAAISVTSVNDAPVNSVPGPQSTQQSTALVFSAANGNAIGIGDVDAGTSDVQVTLTPSNGTVSLGSSAGLSSIAVSAGSTIITGSLASLNSALNGLTFTPTPSFTGAASLQLVTDDLGNSGAGGALSAASTVPITVSADTAPTVIVSGSALAYTENDPATAIAPALTVSDVDSPLLDHAVVRISGNYASGQDVLAFTNQAGITGSWDASTGTLTLTGSASAASYQTALRAVTYRNLGDNPSTAARVVSFVVNDGVSDSAIATVTINVAAVNDAPVNTAPVTQTTNEDTALIFSAAGGNEIRIVDVDAGTAAVKVTLTASSGKLTLAQVVGLTIGGTGNGSGSMTLIGSVDDINAALNGLRFDPAADFTGTVSVHIASEDQGNSGAGGALSADATVSLSVVSVNDAPSGGDRTVTTLEDTGYVFAASDFGFSDPHDASAPNSLLAVCITTLPTAGQLTDNGSAVLSGQFISASDLAAGKLIYTPGGDGSGAAYASFTFQVQDNGGTANGGVDLNPAPNAITVNVTAVNDAPQGADATVTTNEDTPYVFGVVDFGFSDTQDSPENLLLGVRIATLPAAGALTDNGIAVTAGQVISASDITSGKLHFAPAPNASGTGYSSFAFQVQDDGGTANGGVDLDPTPRSITIDVTAVDDAPVIALNAGTTTTPGGASAIDAAALAATDVDNTSAQLVYTVGALPTSGTLVVNGVPLTTNGTFTQADVDSGLLIYQNTGSGAASDGFTFTISDGAGGSVGPAAFSITIASPAPVSQPPVVTPPVVASAPPPVIVTPPAPAPSPPPASSTPSTPAPTEPTDSGAGNASPSSPPPSPGSSAETTATPVGASVEIAQPLNGTPPSSARATNASAAGETRVTTAPLTKLQAVANGMSGVFSGAVIVQDGAVPEGQTATLAIGSMQVGSLPDSSMPQLEAYRASLGNKSWVGELNRLRDAADNQIKVEHKVVGSTVAITGAMSVGYVMWLLRGGLLLSSLLSSMPAWHVIDPMPVLARGNRREDEDGGDDPLERLFGRAKAAVAMSRERAAPSGTETPDAVLDQNAVASSVAAS